MTAYDGCGGSTVSQQHVGWCHAGVNQCSCMCPRVRLKAFIPTMDCFIYGNKVKPHAWLMLHGPLPSSRVPVQTMIGLFSQEAQYRVIKTHHLHKASMAAYCSRCAHVAMRMQGTVMQC